MDVLQDSFDEKMFSLRNIKLSNMAKRKYMYLNVVKNIKLKYGEKYFRCGKRSTKRPDPRKILLRIKTETEKYLGAV